VVRDSAGIRIVENSRQQWSESQEWTVGAEPLFEVGVVEGAPEYQLSKVRGAVRLSDGRVVIAHGDAKELRYYNAGGQFIMSVGRAGGGPGEFQGMDEIYAYRGDSIAVWDPDSRRVSVFGADGGFGRVTTIQGGRSVFVYLRGVLPDGSLVAEPLRPLEALLKTTDGEQRDSTTYVRYTMEGHPADTLAVRADREYVNLRAQSFISQESVLFGRDSYAAAGNGRIFVGENDAFQVDALAPDGTPVMSIRRAVELQPVTGEQLSRVLAEVEEERQKTGAQVAAATGGAVPKQGGRESPRRETVPAFDRLIVDRKGNLWTRDFLVSDQDPPRWSVFDTEGRWLGTVQTPTGLEIYEIGSDWIVGKIRDELDVEYVRVYRLNKG
jgi:hypothetical protein